MFSIPLAKKIDYHEVDANKGSFTIEPLYPGYGLTLGNALRRVLLSSLSGAAIEAVKIKGVDHEFSTIEWVKEDVVDIILNLKEVRIKVDDEIFEQAQTTGEPIKLTLTVKGVKVVKAGDFKKMAGITIANPDQLIATLTDSAANFEIEVFVGCGLGYNPTESRKDKNYEVGVMAIDASYTPIRRVGYDIQNVRVGDMTNWDKLTLNIETDGTLAAQTAFAKSANILVEQFQALNLADSTITDEQSTKKKKVVKETEDLKPNQEDKTEL